MDTADVSKALELLRKGVTIKDQEEIMSLRSVILDLREEIIGLNEKNGELETQIHLVKNLTFKEPFYYVEGDDVPYCAKCWEADKKAIHLVEIGGNVFHCPGCDAIYVPGYKGRPRGISSSKLTRE